MTIDDYPELTHQDKKHMSQDGIDRYEKMREKALKEIEENEQNNSERPAINLFSVSALPLYCIAALEDLRCKVLRCATKGFEAFRCEILCHAKVSQFDINI